MKIKKIQNYLFSGKTSLCIGMGWLLFQGFFPPIANSILPPPFSPCLTICMLLLLFLLYSHWICSLFGEEKPWRELWQGDSLLHVKLQGLVQGMLLALLFYPTQTLLCGMLGSWLKQEPFPMQSSAQYFIHNLSYAAYMDILWTILLIAILAPISEELTFRGLFQSYLQKYLPKPLAILFSSIIFTLLHVIPTASLQQNTWLLAGTLYSSLFFGYLYNRYASLYVPIGAHILMNALTLLFIFLTFRAS